jgi:hypothetical protein
LHITDQANFANETQRNLTGSENSAASISSVVSAAA